MKEYKLNLKDILLESNIGDEPVLSDIKKAIFEYIKKMMREPGLEYFTLDISLKKGAGLTIADMVNDKAILTISCSIPNTMGHFPVNLSPIGHHIKFNLDGFGIDAATDYINPSQAWVAAAESVIGLMCDYEVIQNSIRFGPKSKSSLSSMSIVNVNDNGLNERVINILTKLMNSGFSFDSIQMSDNDISNETAMKIAPLLNQCFNEIILDHNNIGNEAVLALVQIVKTFRGDYTHTKISMFDNTFDPSSLYSIYGDAKEFMFNLDPELDWYTDSAAEEYCGREGGNAYKACDKLFATQRKPREPKQKAALKLMPS